MKARLTEKLLRDGWLCGCGLTILKLARVCLKLVSTIPISPCVNPHSLCNQACLPAKPAWQSYTMKAGATWRTYLASVSAMAQLCCSRWRPAHWRFAGAGAEAKAAAFRLREMLICTAG